MPCLRDVILPWQLQFHTYTWRSRHYCHWIRARTRDFRLCFFPLLFGRDSRIAYDKKEMAALFIHSFINFCVREMYIFVFVAVPSKEREKMRRMHDFIVQRANKLISIGSVSFHCIVGPLPFLLSLLFGAIFFSSVAFFPRIFVWRFSVFNRVHEIFLIVIVFKSNMFSFGYQKRIRYELQCN